jgi:proteasome lid subunit RPN8/RPN11
VQFPRPVRRLVLPDPTRATLRDHVAHEHPEEAGGYLRCERRGGALVATGSVPVENDADEPIRRFETTVDERAPGLPRVFYHSHTLASAPDSLTETDRRQIPERYALVLFAPHGEVFTFRAFKRGLARWHPIAVTDHSGATVDTPLARPQADRQ